MGELFDIQVIVDGVDPFDEVFAFGFDLNYSTDWLLSDIQVGPGFDFNDSALFPNTDVAGSVDFLNFGPNGDGIVLANLSFTSSVAGIFDFAILSDLFDPNEGLFTFTDTFDLSLATQLTISDTVAVVPIPPTAWLFATGLVGLVGLSRRRSQRLPRGPCKT